MEQTPEDLEAQAAAAMKEIAVQLTTQPPRIDDTSFSENERRHVDTILLMMGCLNDFIERFAADIDLFEHAESQKIGHPWSVIACRDAALTLKDFRDALCHIAKATDLCLRLCTPPLRAAIKVARESFDGALPDVTPSRHVAAHSADHVGSHLYREKNKLSHAPILIQLSRIGRRVISSSDGREVAFEISAATLDVLKAVRTQVFEAIRARQRT